MNDAGDVVVVGAGPVGLLMAVEVALAGARVMVLERLAAPSLLSKALGIGPLGVEALQRRGMAEAIAEAEARAAEAMQAFMAQTKAPGIDRARSIGHFAGLMIPKAAQTDPARRSRLVDQQAVEAMLAARASELGVEVRREREVTGFEPQDDAVTVRWASPTEVGEIRCAYLVGCDGGRSSIRKSAGVDFPGAPATMTMYTAICDLDHPERLGPPGFRLTPEGMFFYGPSPRRLGILDFSGPPQDRQAPVTREAVEAALRRVTGADVRVATMDSAGRWADNTRLADTYRKGRVLIAGDAAHVHSPFGGQGLSLGLGDAANLGWKLAAVVRGHAPDTLLDTYTAERRPVAEAVLANTLAQAAIMRPDPRSAALRAVLADLMRFDEVGRYFGEMVGGLSVRYDLGPEPDIVGRLAGDRPIGDSGETLYSLMRDGQGVLLDATPAPGFSGLIGAVPGVRYAAVDTGPSMLLRPDACVVWAGGEQDKAGLRDALRRWFVAPPVQPPAPARARTA